MIKDPVCGMQVAEATAAARSAYKGRRYYFCSALCKQLFEGEPQKYVLPAEDHEKTP